MNAQTKRGDGVTTDFKLRSDFWKTGPNWQTHTQLHYPSTSPNSHTPSSLSNTVNWCHFTYRQTENVNAAEVYVLKNKNRGKWGNGSQREIQLVSYLVFYAQSTITVVSGREKQRMNRQMKKGRQTTDFQKWFLKNWTELTNRYPTSLSPHIPK